MSKHVVWEPVEGGSEKIYLNGGDSMGIPRPSELVVGVGNRLTIVMSKLDMHGTSWYGHGVRLPDNIRLCRQVEVPAEPTPVVPDGAREAIFTLCETFPQHWASKLLQAWLVEMEANDGK